ncbi:MAG TPA: amidohydrolase family protein [Polyangia bacterium]|jgi:5-methylthioadenosine/S-adenosylhomocysteine deaminase|nr:amidohydrolase family protein [Polyangia bacterium]HWE28484.1 amidohydrolase family protein [Polyangia bacterium]
MLLTSDVALVDGQMIPRFAVRVVDGAIAATGPRDTLEKSGEVILDLGHKALLPGTVNAHNHSFQSLLRGFGDDLPFLEWRDKALYRFSPRLGVDGIYTGALFAFAEMALHGVTTVCDFFYINDGANDCARAVIAAARAVGMRIVMARCFYDWDGAPAQYRETISQATENFHALHDEFKSARDVLVCPAPHSLHGASPDMIRAGAEAALSVGTRWHIHLAEEQYQVEDAQKKYGTTPLRAIDKLGLLDENMVAVHGCWFDAGERALLAERGAKLAYNPNSNMFLGDGITDIVDLVARGAKVALGTDGGCSNSRVSVFDEMRACALLQKVARTNGQAIDAETCFQMGTAWGGEVLGLPTGRLAVGQRADVVFVDLDDPSLWPEQSLAKNVVYSLSARAVSDVFVDGQAIVRDGKLTKLQLAEVQARVRELTKDWRAD